MKLVLDTDVLIDILRGYTAAVDWFATLTETPAIVSLVVMELVQGCHNRSDIRAVEQLVAPLEIWFPHETEMRLALETFTKHYLRNHLSIIDAIVGSVVASRSGLLCTFNARHYQPIEGLQTVQPYSKTGEAQR